MKSIRRMFKIDVIKKHNAKSVRRFQILIFLLIIAIVIDFLEIFKVSLAIGILSFFLIFFMTDILRIAIVSSGMDKISDDDIKKINNDFSFRNGLVFDKYCLGLFDTYLFSYEPFMVYCNYSDIKKIIYNLNDENGVKKYYFSIFTKEEISLSVIVSDNPFDNEMNDIVNWFKKIDNSIIFIDLVNNKKDR